MLTIILTAAASTAAYAAILRIKRNTVAFDRTVHQSEAVQVAYDKMMAINTRINCLEEMYAVAKLAEALPYMSVVSSIKDYKPPYFKTMLKRAEKEHAEYKRAYKKAVACAATETLMYGKPKDVKTRTDLFYRKYTPTLTIKMDVDDPAEVKELLSKYTALKADGYDFVDALGVSSIEKTLGKKGAEQTPSVEEVIGNADTSGLKSIPEFMQNQDLDGVEIPKLAYVRTVTGHLYLFNFNSNVPQERRKNVVRSPGAYRYDGTAYDGELTASMEGNFELSNK